MDKEILLEGERIDEVNERIRLIQKKDGLTFGTDAYLLAAYMRRQPKACAAELGCGTGIISLLCAAREKFDMIHAIEIQEEFASLSERNVSLNSLGDKIKIHSADIRALSAADVGGELDVVFANPPYMTATSGKGNLCEAKNIARHEICGGIYDFAECARRLLKHGGRFYCVWRPDRLSSLFSALRDNRLEPKEMVFVHADENAEPSMVLVCAKKAASEALRISPPLIMHAASNNGGKRELSERAQKIYDTMSFE